MKSPVTVVQNLYQQNPLVRCGSWTDLTRGTFGLLMVGEDLGTLRTLGNLGTTGSSGLHWLPVGWTPGTVDGHVKLQTTFINESLLWSCSVLDVLSEGSSGSSCSSSFYTTKYILLSSPATGRWGGPRGEELGVSERTAGQTGCRGSEGQISEGGGSDRGAEAPEESEDHAPPERVHLGPDKQVPPHVPTGQWSREDVVFLNEELNSLVKWTQGLDVRGVLQVHRVSLWDLRSKFKYTV